MAIFQLDAETTRAKVGDKVIILANGYDEYFDRQDENEHDPDRVRLEGQTGIVVGVERDLADVAVATRSFPLGLYNNEFIIESEVFNV